MMLVSSSNTFIHHFSRGEVLGAMPYVIIAIVLVLGAIVTMIVLTVRRRGPIPAEGIAEPEAPPRKKIFMPRSMKPDGDGDE